MQEQGPYVGEEWAMNKKKKVLVKVHHEGKFFVHVNKKLTSLM